MECEKQTWVGFHWIQGWDHLLPLLNEVGFKMQPTSSAQTHQKALAAGVRWNDRTCMWSVFYRQLWCPHGPEASTKWTFWKQIGQKGQPHLSRPVTVTCSKDVKLCLIIETLKLVAIQSGPCVPLHVSHSSFLQKTRKDSCGQWVDVVDARNQRWDWHDFEGKTLVLTFPPKNSSTHWHWHAGHILGCRQDFAHIGPQDLSVRHVQPKLSELRQLSNCWPSKYTQRTYFKYKVSLFDWRPSLYLLYHVARNGPQRFSTPSGRPTSSMASTTDMRFSWYWALRSSLTLTIPSSHASVISSGTQKQNVSSFKIIFLVKGITQGSNCEPAGFQLHLPRDIFG